MKTYKEIFSLIGLVLLTWAGLYFMVAGKDLLEGNPYETVTKRQSLGLVRQVDQQIVNNRIYTSLTMDSASITIPGAPLVTKNAPANKEIRGDGSQLLCIADNPCLPIPFSGK